MDVGTLSTGAIAHVEADGVVSLHDGGRIGWRIRPADTWLTPGADVGVRQTRRHPAPVVYTATRVPGGDAEQRVYAVERDGGVVVVEVENASPNAIAVAIASSDLEGWHVASSRPSGATEPDGALVYPVPHRTTLRVAVARARVDARGLPDVAAVARAWDQILDRGMRVELPEPLGFDVDAARADLLLAPPSAATFAALEAWGFDDEAIAMWDRLRRRDRRSARTGAYTGVLADTHAALVHEHDRVIDAFPGFRPAWLGQPLAVHDAPLRAGVVSFALRWHGARPALLWDVPGGFGIRASALDPAFASHESRGETLLAEPPTALLAMGTREPVGGAAIEPPEAFT